MIPERRCRRFNPTTVEVFYKWYSYACFANLLYYKNVSENTNNGVRGGFFALMPHFLKISIFTNGAMVVV